MRDRAPASTTEHNVRVTQLAECAHYAHDQTATVHCVMHCLGLLLKKKVQN